MAYRVRIVVAGKPKEQDVEAIKELKQHVDFVKQYSRETKTTLLAWRDDFNGALKVSALKNVLSIECAKRTVSGLNFHPASWSKQQHVCKFASEPFEKLVRFLVDNKADEVTITKDDCFELVCDVDLSTDCLITSDFSWKNPMRSENRFKKSLSKHPSFKQVAAEHAAVIAKLRKKGYITSEEVVDEDSIQRLILQLRGVVYAVLFADPTSPSKHQLYVGSSAGAFASHSDDPTGMLTTKSPGGLRQRFVSMGKSHCGNCLQALTTLHIGSDQSAVKDVCELKREDVAFAAALRARACQHRGYYGVYVFVLDACVSDPIALAHREKHFMDVLGAKTTFSYNMRWPKNGTGHMCKKNTAKCFPKKCPSLAKFTTATTE
eukprot:TRINITY_DN13532_c0_g1_i1.p1 TRINITY_DN13532_c0_g1~~TRINITY_DN13532_c0_g1_i1.p1  ORF type:complete len:377 (+),score=43.21 TRINITY_DN13532_c0_g1_i1:49-1179(+)